MGAHRGFKAFKQAASRRFKHVPSAAKRGHKFVSHHIKSLGDADTLARKAADTLHNVGEYAALGSALTGSDRLRDILITMLLQVLLINSTVGLQCMLLLLVVQQLSTIMLPVVPTLSLVGH